MLKKTLIAFAVIVIVFVIIVATRRADFRITRSATIAAPAEVVFAQVNEFKKWEAWSPWAKLDPAMKQTYAGPAAGTGASYAWAGNNEVGEGRMTLTESRTNELIRIKLEFLKPFTAVNSTEFTFKPDGKQTTVTWDMSGTNNFISKAFCMFMDMDKTVGGDFDKGLAQLKSVAEAAAKKQPAAP